MKLLSEIVESKSLKTTINEELDGLGQTSKACYISGPFIVTESRNKNNRIYKRDTLLREVQLFTEEKIRANRAAGELNHPESPTINLDRISHYVTELRQDGDVFYGKARLASTPMGLIAQALVKDGYQLGVSTRGLGSVADDGEVGDDFKLIAVDLVSEPSAHKALVEAIFENKNYIIKNGIVFEESMKELDNKLSKLPVKNQDEFLAKAIVDYIKSLR